MSSIAQITIGPGDTHRQLISDQLEVYAMKREERIAEIKEMCDAARRESELAVSKLAARPWFIRMLIDEREVRENAIEAVFARCGYGLIGLGYANTITEQIQLEVDHARTIIRMMRYGKTVTFDVEYLNKIQKKGLPND